MRTLTKPFWLLLLLLGLQAPAAGQTTGRVVINEYLPWSGCTPNGEFIELMNFGPGPVNIGCYILTNGQYAVTIPPNTIIQPGEYFVLAGQDVLPKSCGNIDSAVQVQLNWNTCNCMDKPLPAGGDGLFTDGGAGNEKVVLLDPSLKVVDAVTRDAVVAPSDPLTSVALGGGCASKTFDLDTMTIHYEALGMSTGKDNSFARTLDGDCEWLKDPPQSAHATNNRPGDKPSAIDYGFTIVGSRDCDANHGSIDIYVNIVDTTVADYRRTFPMSYTDAFDSNRNGRFDLNDTYTSGVDSTAPSISIIGLPLGSHRVTVSSVAGCFLATFEFYILECVRPMAVQLPYFKLLHRQNGVNTFEWLVNDVERLATIELQKSTNGLTYISEATLHPQSLVGTAVFNRRVAESSSYTYYRVHLVDREGRSSYSRVIRTLGTPATARLWPNPASETVQVEYESPAAGTGRYTLYDGAGRLVRSGSTATQQGLNRLAVPLKGLPSGLYQLAVTPPVPGGQPISFRFVIPGQ